MSRNNSINLLLRNISNLMLLSTMEAAVESSEMDPYLLASHR